LIPLACEAEAAPTDLPVEDDADGRVAHSEIEDQSMNERIASRLARLLLPFGTVAALVTLAGPISAQLPNKIPDEDPVGLAVTSPPVPTQSMLAAGMWNKKTLTVENDRNHEAIVFIEHDGFDTRLGAVPAHQTTTFQLPVGVRRREADIFVEMRGEARDLRSDNFDVSQHEHLLVHVRA
jgi:hypothetical protein